MRNHFGGSAALIGLTGLDFLPGFTAPKILWLKRHEPENFAKLDTVLLPHDYLNFVLTGKTTMEYGDASGTALMDVRKRAWSREVCEFIDVALMDKLPELMSSREPGGELKPDIAKRWGLSGTVIVSAGGGDNMMGAIGTANTQPGRVTASLGTSGTLYAYSANPAVDPKGEIAAFCDSTDAWLPLVCTMNVTVATEQARIFLVGRTRRWKRRSRACRRGSEGLLFLPYLTGERTPSPTERHGRFSRADDADDETRAHDACDNGRSDARTGVRHGRLARIGVAPSEIRLIGGGSKSAAWRQICAGYFDCRVVTVMEPEGAALGAAIQGAAAADSSRSIPEWANALVKVNEAETVEPKREFDYAAALNKQGEMTRCWRRKSFSKSAGAQNYRSTKRFVTDGVGQIHGFDRFACELTLDHRDEPLGDEILVGNEPAGRKGAEHLGMRVAVEGKLEPLIGGGDRRRGAAVITPRTARSV